MKKDVYIDICGVQELDGEKDKMEMGIQYGNSQINLNKDILSFSISDNVS